MKFDLHTHTTLSDGALTPTELIQRAVDQQVDALAITDHDTVDAYRDLDVATSNIRLVSGVEFSTQWERRGIHVLGLNVDLGSEAINTGTQFQTGARLDRAGRIAANLDQMGIPDALSGARSFSAGSYIGRPHFARYLVDSGKVKDIESAFKKYLGDGKAGDVKQHWADLSQIIQWIRDANGVAVLAHPLKYKLTRTKLKRLLDDFLMAGGQGMEVISGQQSPQQTADMAHLCEFKNLLASCGSDFHAPGYRWGELGVFSALPDYLTPVWERF